MTQARTNAFPLTRYITAGIGISFGLAIWPYAVGLALGIAPFYGLFLMVRAGFRRVAPKPQPILVSSSTASSIPDDFVERYDRATTPENRAAIIDEYFF